MRQELVNHFTWLANHISQCNEYKGWDAEYKIKELEEGFKIFNNSLKKYIDFENLTVDEARELRFSKWSDESDLWLIPLYLKPLLPTGLKVTTIDGEVLEVGKDYLDDDIRFGVLAYGIVIK